MSLCIFTLPLTCQTRHKIHTIKDAPISWSFIPRSQQVCAEIARNVILVSVMKLLVILITGVTCLRITRSLLLLLATDLTYVVVR